MEYLFVPPKQSLQIKELGFDEPCLGRHYYKESYPMLNPQSEETELVFEFGQYIKQTDVTILSPTFAQAFTFFREKYGLYIQPNRIVDSEGIWYYFSISTKRTDVCEGSFIYKEAELACLIKLIDIVKARNIGEQFTSTPKN
jgi:hypothetical protein